MAPKNFVAQLSAYVAQYIRLVLILSVDIVLTVRGFHSKLRSIYKLV